MIDEQFAVSFRAFSRRRPFKPFAIDFVNGQKVTVRHPEGAAPFGSIWLFLEPGGQHIVFAGSSICRVFDLPEG